MSQQQPSASATTPESRAAGAILGSIIGDALAMGCHWYYDLQELDQTYGYVKDYVEPLPGKYHYGALHKGDLTQTGELQAMLLRSIHDKGGYDVGDFTQRWDKLLASLDGTRQGGPHGWTSKDMCDVWKRRVVEKREWGDCASPLGDTTDSMIRAAALGARYFQEPQSLCESVRRDARLHFEDKGVITQSLCFGLAVAMLVEGHKLNAGLGGKLYQRAQKGEIPFSFSAGTRDQEEGLAEPDGLLWASAIIRAAQDPKAGGAIGNPTLGPSLYGTACAWFMQLPSAYYVAARHQHNFEEALCVAVNAGGNNCARAALVGALVGAVSGIEAIPRRWIEQLTNGKELEEKAIAVGWQAVQQAMAKPKL